MNRLASRIDRISNYLVKSEESLYRKFIRQYYEPIEKVGGVSSMVGKLVDTLNKQMKESNEVLKEYDRQESWDVDELNKTDEVLTSQLKKIWSLQFRTDDVEADKFADGQGWGYEQLTDENRLELDHIEDALTSYINGLRHIIGLLESVPYYIGKNRKYQDNLVFKRKSSKRILKNASVDSGVLSTIRQKVLDIQIQLSELGKITDDIKTVSGLPLSRYVDIAFDDGMNELLRELDKLN